MKISKYSKKPTLILILLCIWIIYPNFTNLVSINEVKDNNSNFQEPEFRQLKHDTNSFLKWKEQTSKVDQNNNGLSDNFEDRLKDLSEFGFINESKRDLAGKKVNNDIFRIKPRNKEEITMDDIPVIVSFPTGDYDLSLSLYKELGGKVKSTYKSAINGFAGRMNYNALNEFCSLLKHNNIIFLVEEDKIYESQLYYAGRNMNLRPYVWNALSYDGDNYSSIAIIDTGIDDSHNFFTPGYSAGDPAYKIIGWRDEINNFTTPYDDNGHGSHCSGIASGEGNPNYDVSGRTVVTNAFHFNNTGNNLPPGIYTLNVTRFNVTDPGLIEIFYEFEDFTPGPDNVDSWAYLYYGETIVDSIETNSDNWSDTLSHSATTGSLGEYSFRIKSHFIDNNGDGLVSDIHARDRSEIHWPFNPPLFSCGDPWKGVAPDANFVGVKVLDQYGYGWTSDIINGINWVITNKSVYNITTMSLSLGGYPSFSMVSAVNNAVENGIVTIAAAGNRGPHYYIGSPGDADNVITVAAMNIDDEITDYSSGGGLSYTGNTIKPDITAPGGSLYNIQMFSTDTNDNDAEGGYPSDGYANDMMGTQGTSMATPAVAGASNLLIEAMGGHQSWGYTGTEAKRVKALILMSATETYPLLRETFDFNYSPELNRGGKDIHEGYGRLNIDIALEAYTHQLSLGSQQNAWITSSSNDPFGKHGIGCYVNLVNGNSYVFGLDVPDGADFDLHLYSNNPSSTGEPIMVASSTSNGLGIDEVISYSANETGKYYLIAKAISGEGNAVIIYPILDHDLSVSLEIPTNPDIHNTYLINATVKNTGNNIESNIDLFLYLDGSVVNFTNILSLPIGARETIEYTWTPTERKTYNFTVYSPSMPSETFLLNNRITKLILIRRIVFFEDFENGLSKWETFTGLWHLTDDTSSWSNPYHSPTHSMWYGNETTGDYYTPFYRFGDLISKPIDLSSFDDLTLEFYHWREADEDDWDASFIYISTDGINWDLLYESYTGYISPWEKVSLDISGYSGNPTVQLKFSLSPYDLYKSGYRGWLVDDIEIFGGPIYDHDLSVSLEVPNEPDINNTYIINATVTNTGINNETSVDMYLYRDSILVNSSTISNLPFGASETIHYTWTPTEYKKYNFTVYSPSVPSESNIINNIITKLISIRKRIFYEDFESGLSKWQTYTGLWHLTDDTSRWPYPSHSPTRSMWFGDETTGCYNTHYHEKGDLISNPIDLSPFEDIILEFYHWRESEVLDYYDVSFVYISTDGINWDLIYQSGTEYIPPWEKISIDISDYTSNPSVQLKFSFDTVDEIHNDYRGWLVDDIEILGLKIYDHDLSVSLEVPNEPDINNTYIINAIVTNMGNNTESNVDLSLYLDGSVVNSTSILSLPIDASETINYLWTPTEYKKYNFTVNAAALPSEPQIINNEITKFISVREITIFDGLFIAYNWTIFGDVIPTEFIYSYVSEDLFHIDADLNFTNQIYWDVNPKTRIMEKSGGDIYRFGSGVHTPMWIYPDMSLGNQILIAVDGEGDHIFNVSSESTIVLPYFGTKDVWVLEDLTSPGGIAWYEKSTGILLNGTVLFGGSITFKWEFVFTNAFGLDHDLYVTLEVPTSSDKDKTYLINATVTNRGNNTESNVDFSLFLDGSIVNSTTVLSLPIGASETINYIWNPTEYKMYNFTAYASPILGEEFFINNIATKKIIVTKNYTMIPGVTYSWVNASDGAQIPLDLYDYVAVSLPFNFTFYDEIFSTIYIFSEGYLTFADPVSHFENVQFPSAFPLDTFIIAPFWSDEGTYMASNYIYVQLFDTFLVVEWHRAIYTDWFYFCLFEVILFENGEIIFNYDYLDYVDQNYNGYTCGLNLGVDTRYYNSFQGLNNLIDDFSIRFTLPGLTPDSLTAITPDSSSSWGRSTSQYIYWNSTGSISNVKIELYKNGFFEMEIASSIHNDGEYYWTVPSDLDGSNQYQIKIIDVSNSSTYDFSDYFEIYIPDSLNVITPDSSSSWEKGTSKYIYWNSTGSISNVKIELYKSGYVEMEISSSTPNDGEYYWSIPSSLESSNLYKIKITDSSNPFTHDYSEFFEIKNRRSRISGYPLYILMGLLGIVSIFQIRKIKKIS
jgi:subtilase family serine protease